MEPSRGFARPVMRNGREMGRWGEGYILSFKRGETRTLRPHMTFHIPSMVKIFGFADAGTSETVRVTESGCELLTHFDRRLFARPEGM